MCMQLRISQVVFLFSVCFVAVCLGLVGIYNLSRSKVKVEWSTASELRTVGFNVYRSDEINPELTRLNEVLIPPSVDSLIGGEYIYIDSDVKPGNTYYYYLEELDASGNASRFGPIEVNAQRGGIVEILIAFSILAIGLIGYLIVKPNLVITTSTPTKENNDGH